MVKLDPQLIKDAASAIDAVRNIDDNIKKFGDFLENSPDKVGKETRKAIGANLLHKFDDDKLGKVVLCGLINELLRSRGSIVERYSEIVQFPGPPCPRQEVGD